jgi:hypothetical protein
MVLISNTAQIAGQAGKELPAGSFLPDATGSSTADEQKHQDLQRLPPIPQEELHH